MIFALCVSVAVLAAFNLITAHFQAKFNAEVIATFKAIHETHEAQNCSIANLSRRTFT